VKHYDLIIIGSGSGLMVLEAALAKGLSCAIVERSKFGGTCLTKGCIPSKMLVYPADLIRDAEQASRIGVQLGTPSVDWERVSTRMWKQINYSKRIAENLHEMPGVDVYEATGEFTGPNTLSVKYLEGSETEEISGDRFVIAAGARSFVPNIEGLAEVGYITSETFFGDKFPEKPWERLLIVGGGAIGTEFAHIFSAFGSKVTVVEMGSRLIATEEEEISEFVQQQFVESGIDIFNDSRAVAASSENGSKKLVVENTKTGERQEIITDEIFISSGVRSNSDLLRCDAAGIDMDARGWIITNEHMETSQKHIYAIGDINGKYQFRHTANYEAEILINNLFTDREKRSACYDAVPWAIYTRPQVGHVGLTERQARGKGYRVFIGRNYYSDVAAGIAMGHSQHYSDNGFVKIVAGEDKRILGVHVVGPHAAILVQPFEYLINTGFKCDSPYASDADREWCKARQAIYESCRIPGTLRPIMDSMVIHPSLNELTAWAIEEIEWEE
jgi:mycothione reductase